MKLRTYSRLILALSLGVGLMVALAIPGGSKVSAAEIGVELTHPQSDDQGHYVGASYWIRVTVFGLLSHDDGIRTVTVNGKEATLFHGRYQPWGQTADDHALEFRASVRLRPTTKLVISAQGGSGETTRVVFQADADATIARLRRLVAEGSGNARAHDRLGNALTDRGMVDEGIDEFRKALELDPESVESRVQLSKALLARHEREQAMSELRKAVEIDPNSAMAWVHLGLAHLKLTGNTQEALRCFRRYLELEPSSTTADKIRRYVEATPR